MCIECICVCVCVSASAELSSWRASSEKTVMELQEAQATLTQQLTQAQAQLHDAQAALNDARKAHVRLRLFTRSSHQLSSGPFIYVVLAS
jgi:hypothetical protein